MDRTDQIITLLQALVSSGGIAAEMQGRVATIQHTLASDAAVSAQMEANSNEFVNEALAGMATDILASGGDLTTIGDVINEAYAIGLLAGLAVGAASQDL